MKFISNIKKIINNFNHKNDGEFIEYNKKIIINGFKKITYIDFSNKNFLNKKFENQIKNIDFNKNIYISKYGISNTSFDPEEYLIYKGYCKNYNELYHLINNIKLHSNETNKNIKIDRYVLK